MEKLRGGQARRGDKRIKGTLSGYCVHHFGAVYPPVLRFHLAVKCTNKCIAFIVKFPKNIRKMSLDPDAGYEPLHPFVDLLHPQLRNLLPLSTHPFAVGPLLIRKNS